VPVRGKSKQAVQAQFGRQASWYVVSSVHQRSDGLDALLRLAAPRPTDRALDIATGTGFTALALAPQCREIVGMDLTFGMVREARRLAWERRASSLTFCLGDAEALPFQSNTFDIVTCRHAAHHFPDIPRALQEMARVAKIGGRVVLDDTCAPETPALESQMNEWERRRDPSHGANHPPSRLRQMLEASGLCVERGTMTFVPLEFNDWVKRGGVSRDEAHALRASLLDASAEARAAFRIRREPDGTLRFAWPEIVVLGIKPPAR
jgi:ubiquinone/menaquinone biosynthesis C-methylase UbiE